MYEDHENCVVPGKHSQWLLGHPSSFVNHSEVHVTLHSNCCKAKQKQNC